MHLAFGPSHALGRNMKTLKPYLLALAVVTLAGCSATSTKTADVSGSIRTSLDQAGFKDVSSSQDRDKGVVTLGGHVAAEGDKVASRSHCPFIRREPGGGEPDRGDSAGRRERREENELLAG